MVHLYFTDIKGIPVLQSQRTMYLPDGKCTGTFTVSRGNNIDVGQEIICPMCERVMLRCIKKPVPKSNKMTEWFEMVGFKGEKGDKTICPDCRFPFMDNKIGAYTKEYGFTW